MHDAAQTDGFGRRAFLARTGSAVAGSALGLGLSGLGFASTAVGGQKDASQPLASPFEWVAIRPGVYASSNLETGGNCLVVRGGDRCLLVDTKFPAFAPRIKRDAEALTGLAPTHVVNTHHHGDHSGGNQAFTGSTVVIAHENGVPRVRAQFERNMSGVTGGGRTVDRAPEQFRASLMKDVESLLAKADGFGAGDWVANTPVATSTTGLDLDGEWIAIRHFGRPSHTDNDLVIHLTSSNVIHTGDVVFSGLHPYFDANGGASSADWIETLSEIHDLCDADTAVVPGHGPVGTREIVRNQQRYIEQLRESVQRGIDDGTPLDELRATTFPFMEGMGFDRLRENAIVFVYNELTGG
jgi:cyclase